MSVKFPEDITLLASTHGTIVVENSQVKTFVVPEGMTINRFMMARPGICNVTTEDQIDSVIGTLRSKPQETQRIVKSSTSVVIKAVMMDIKNDEPNKALLQQYVRSGTTLLQAQTFRPGDTILDKEFSRSKEEGMSNAFDFKMNIVNMPGVPDLLDLAYSRSPGVAARTRLKAGSVSATLSGVIGLLQSMNVRTVTLYDFTCSSFMSDDTMTDRDERTLRRDIQQKGLGRKRSGRQSKKTKTRRAKKRNVQWSY